MWKWIILALAAYALYRLFSNDWKKKQEKSNDKTEMERKVAAGEMVKDPECGAFVDAAGTITVRDGDVVHRFCSYDCRDAFLKRLEAGGRTLPERTKNDAA
ncbi:MAG: transcriptional regulator [Desulfovibrionaceae bacterium]|nr:transcriptional regulator [Desulfovibrionaceae bacterium]